MNPLARVRIRQALADHAQHDGVVHQLAGLHGLLGRNAQRRAARDGRTQQVPGGDLRNAKALHEALRLRALAGAGGPQ